jgi:hypothetical protein
MANATAMLRAALEAANSTPVPFPIEYRHWPVEQLLSEAMGLLERCLELKRFADSLVAEEAKLQLELRDDLVKDAQETWTLKRLHETSGEIGNAVHAGVTQRGALEVQESQSAALFATDDGQTKNKTPTTMSGRVTNGGVIASILEFERSQHDLSERLLFLDPVSVDRLQPVPEGPAIPPWRPSDVRTLRKEWAAEASLQYLDRAKGICTKLLTPYLKDACDRCVAAYKGLQEIFGVDSADPLPADAADIDALAGWSRRQVSFIARFGHLDQGLTVSIPLSVKKQNGGSQDLSVTVPQSTFPPYFYIRLRSISAFVETAGEPRLFAVEVRLPKSAIYATNGGQIKADQSRMPTCILGRVTARNVARPPEAGGTVSLINASPIGFNDEPWEIQVRSLQKPVANITEIVLELALVGRPPLYADYVH